MGVDCPGGDPLISCGISLLSKPKCLVTGSGFNLCGINLKAALVSINRNLHEFKGLVRSMNYEVVKEFIQTRNHPEPNYFVGPGKLEEIKDFIKSHTTDLVIFDGELKPAQQYNIETTLGTQIYDRIRLILEIFASRANSQEARYQVELARLRYEIPHLREWIHKAKRGEHPGFMSGGEYEIAEYYEYVRTRVKKLKSNLERIRMERSLRRAKRWKYGFFLVSIAGYTNAGKSTLLNKLAGEQVLVEERMFSTLSTTTRRLAASSQSILFTDTVGFINNLPVWLIEAFNSTLEEIYLSDLILLLIDVSDSEEEVERKLSVCIKTLHPKVEPEKILYILTKIDLVSQSELTKKRLLVMEKIMQEPLIVSSKSGFGLDKLIDKILHQSLTGTEIELNLNYDKELSNKINKLFDVGEVLSITYGSNTVKVMLKTRKKDEWKLKKLLSNDKN